MRLSRFPFLCPFSSSLCAFNPPSASSCCVYPTCRSLCLFYHLQFMCQISPRAAGPISCQLHIHLPSLVPPGLDISRVLIQTASLLPLPHSPPSLGSVSPLFCALFFLFCPSLSHVSRAFTSYGFVGEGRLQDHISEHTVRSPLVPSSGNRCSMLESGSWWCPSDNES
jgi:hypothetical protein